MFEQNQRLQTQYPRIVRSAAEAARTSLDLVSHAIGTKADRVLSVADYCIAISTQAIKVWTELCCDIQLLPKKFEYRDFAGIEPSCSVLFASNFRKSVSSRAVRLADHTYFDVAGVHARSCSKAARQIV